MQKINAPMYDNHAELKTSSRLGAINKNQMLLITFKNEK